MLSELKGLVLIALALKREKLKEKIKFVNLSHVKLIIRSVKEPRKQSFLLLQKQKIPVQSRAHAVAA